MEGLLTLENQYVLTLIDVRFGSKGMFIQPSSVSLQERRIIAYIPGTKWFKLASPIGRQPQITWYMWAKQNLFFFFLHVCLSIKDAYLLRRRSLIEWNEQMFYDLKKKNHWLEIFKHKRWIKDKNWQPSSWRHTTAKDKGQKESHTGPGYSSEVECLPSMPELWVHGQHLKNKQANQRRKEEGKSG